MQPQSVWKSVVAELEINLSRANFETWIRPISLNRLEVSGEKYLAEIVVPSGFYRQMMEQRYEQQIREIMERIVKGVVEISFKVGENKTPKPSQSIKEERPLFETARNAPDDKKDRSRRGFLNPRLTFETFVVGSSNNLAHAAALGVVENPGRKYNPLFIYGGVGLGKTHLMHAIGHALLDKYPDFTILYISAETFINDLIKSLRSKRTTAFKKRYRSCDVLLVDDIQFISGKESTQEEFFHTFNELYMAEKQIILTSDRPPNEIPRIEERLSSRFMGGLTVDVQAPDLEMRVGILQQKAKELGQTISSDALEIIAEQVTSNVRELEGTFRKIIAMADLKKMQITPELVSNFFSGQSNKNEEVRRKIRPTSVIAKTAKYFNLPTSEVRGKSRKAPIVHARHIAMYLLKTKLKLPLEGIGELFGGRDHTTVMHGVDKIAVLVSQDSRIKQEVDEVCGLIWG